MTKTMNDRELLKLASRAAGIDWFDEPALQAGKGLHMKSGPFWNPLQDDGDALLLAVGLKLDVQFFDGYAEIHVGGDGITSATVEPYAPDMQAATRRAIVRAAAEIGRTK